MDDPQIRFDDGAEYEEFMGKWSRLAGDVFVDWLAPAPGMRWVDVGCGNGASTALLVERCAPLHVEGIDPSEAQIAFARTRLADRPATFRLGGAHDLPYADASFDAAVMALVIFFVPDPAKGVGEMARVVRPGGSVSAYAWDILGSGFPFAALQEEMAALGIPPIWPPSYDASRIARLHELWIDAGFVDVQTRTITVERTFDDFDTYWKIAQMGPRIAPKLREMLTGHRDVLRDRLRARLTPDASGRITIAASANAVKGRRAA